MKHLCLPVMLIAVLAAGQTLAATQQEKMKTCNADASAKALKGDERKAFMSKCLKMTQQERMTACNKDASDKVLKGDERKTFMSQCLKKD